MEFRHAHTHTHIHTHTRPQTSKAAPGEVTKVKRGDEEGPSRLLTGSRGAGSTGGSKAAHLGSGRKVDVTRASVRVSQAGRSAGMTLIRQSCAGGPRG